MAPRADRWKVLQQCNKTLRDRPITHFLESDPDRLQAFSAGCGDLWLDFSRHRIDREAFGALLDLARDADLGDGIRKLVDGEVVNSTESRPALHTALRSDVGRGAAVQEARAEVALARAGMQRLVSEVHAGERTGVTGAPIRKLVSIGIGGSHLGPQLAVDALAGTEPRLEVEFLANVDGHALDRLCRRLDPASTLFCVISKSFRTRETLLNASTLRQWLAARLGVDDKRAGSQFVAVTAHPQRALAFGIDREAILPMWDWVGGRYSVWSTVGLPLAMAVGMEAFEAFLAGAAAMDRHFVSAPLEANMPVALALLGIWYRNVENIPAYTVVPYDQRLQRLGEYLQQLDMESNGKRVDRDGRPVESATGPACWGGLGTNSQHAYFQWLHQSTDHVPVDFIAVRTPDHDLADHHRELNANLIGQSWALMAGRGEAETQGKLAADGADEWLTPHCTFPGNRPSNVIVVERLTPRALGCLLALYEHKVFVQGWIWGINSFDQWGVELGKTLASRVGPWLEGGVPDDADLDPATRALIARLRR